MSTVPAPSADPLTDIAGGWSTSTSAWLEWPTSPSGIVRAANTPTLTEALTILMPSPTPSNPLYKRAVDIDIPTNTAEHASQTKSVSPEALASARSLLSAMRNIATRSEKDVIEHHPQSSIVRSMVGQQVIYPDEDIVEGREISGRAVVLQDALSSFLSSMINTIISAPAPTNHTSANCCNLYNHNNISYNFYCDICDYANSRDSHDHYNSHHYHYHYTATICDYNNRDNIKSIDNTILKSHRKYVVDCSDSDNNHNRFKLSNTYYCYKYCVHFAVAGYISF
ncbi:hypothetical protein EDC05_000632 [Coemansia umbellata]|uniref:C2H2-type domain-containing protein n=1 Tax=Coemansia umbellata TaxID=1424467 RepID=A0ABQ8PTW9_9FUNG|nr:hypothetical protein EDC05_000632 [Coemansia umbellata]